MKEKHGVTAVIFDERYGKRHFLILHRVLNWSGWEFCKGGIDGSEKPVEAVLREVMEETGLKVSILSALPKKVSWSAKDIKYIYTPFLIRGNMDEEISLEQEIVEHDGFKWVEQEKVPGFLKHEDNKKIFREAIGILDSMKQP